MTPEAAEAAFRLLLASTQESPKGYLIRYPSGRVYRVENPDLSQILHNTQLSIELHSWTIRREEGTRPGFEGQLYSLRLNEVTATGRLRTLPAETTQGYFREVEKHFREVEKRFGTYTKQVITYPYQLLSLRMVSLFWAWAQALPERTSRGLVATP